MVMRLICAIGRRAHPWRPHRALVLVSLGLAGGLTSCGGIEPVTPFAPVTDPTQLYMALTLDHPAAVLSTVAPYDTLRLTATPRDALGQPMAGLPAPSFTSSDTANVQVSADGLVRARGAVSGVTVVATLQQGPVSHVDTAMITVTTEANPPKLASLSIHPVPPDSAVLSPASNYNLFSGLFLPYFAGLYNPQPTLAPRVVDSAGNAVTEDLPFAYTSLDSAIVWIRDPNILVPLKGGQARVVAQTTAYGITVADTVLYTVKRWPFGFDVAINVTSSGAPSFMLSPVFALAVAQSPIRDVHIQPHGIVAWNNYFSEAVDVTFDNPTNVVEPDAALCNVLAFFGDSCDGGGSTVVPGGGDCVSVACFAGFPIGSGRVRQFPVPGVYPFHSVRLGASARVIVGD